jgi:hypothetical protein
MEAGKREATMRLRLYTAASLIAISMLFAVAYADATGIDFKRPRAEIKTKVALVDAHFDFRLRVSCGPLHASRGCAGETYVVIYKLPGHVSGFPMTRPFRRYKVGRGHVRSLAYRLHIGHAFLKKRGRLWVRAYVSVKQGSRPNVERAVLLRFKRHR